MESNKIKIKETIVVEGKDDISAVKSAVDAEVISTHGFGFGYRLLKTLKEIEKRKGLIIFTDPDYMGVNIRRRISEFIPSARHAYLSQEKSYKKGDIGIENAKREDIVMALKKARATIVEKKENFTIKDLRDNGLIDSSASQKRREKFCDILSIGYGNGKQTLNKLNSFGISKEEFRSAIRQVEEDR